MKETKIDKRLPENEAYAQYMVESLSQLRRAKKPASTIQCASMQATIDRDPSKDAEHWNRKIDLEKAIAPHPETCERSIDPFEYNLHEGLRRSVKNTTGQSEKSATTPDRKDRATESFIYSPPAEIAPAQVKKLTKIEPITELKELPKKKKEGFFDKIKKAFAQNTDTHSYAELQKYWEEIEKDKK